MKKLCLIMAIALSLSILSGCALKEENTLSVADSYIEIAMDHYLNGDYDLAISILEKGFEETKDPRIADYLIRIEKAAATAPTEDGTQTEPSQELTAETQPTEPETPIVLNPDYTRYNGNWGNGGYLRIDVQGDQMEIELTTTQGGFSRLAVINEKVSLSQIYDGALWLPFTDSWGSTGNLFIAFFGNRIIYSIRDIVRHPTAMWWFDEGSFSVTRYSGTGIGLNADYAAEGALAGFDADQRMLINIFLSNFSEQNFEAYPASDHALVKFAIQHCKINIPNNLVQQNDLVKISQGNVDTLLQLYFGQTVKAEDGATLHSSAGGETMRYSGGFYEYALASIPDSSYFSVATNMADNGDGTYSVKFNVYHLDDSKYGYSIYPYYGLSDAEARSRSELNFAYSGSAVVRKSQNTDGSAFYQLISYSR